MVYVVYKESIEVEDYFESVVWEVVDYGEESTYEKAESKAKEIINKLVDYDVDEKYSYTVQEI